jgi:hypothetical protein
MHHAPQTPPSETAAYVRAIESCFLEIRGRGVQWSPEDGARALSWHAAGLPLGAALRVLAARVQAYRFRHGDKARVPMSLAWYEPAILDQCKHLQKLGRELTLAPEAAPEPGLVDLLADVPDLLATQPGPVAERAYRQAFDLLDEALRPGESDTAIEPLSDAEEDALLVRCRARMLKTLEQGLAEADALRMAAEVDGRLAPFAGQLSRKALASRRTALVQSWLVAHHGVRLPTRRGWIAGAHEG